jgi:hypothetical protein
MLQQFSAWYDGVRKAEQMLQLMHDVKCSASFSLGRAHRQRPGKKATRNAIFVLLDGVFLIP